ncbi:MAG: hypothetical protein V4714_18160 [Bacteroidota bacterium]
MKKYFLSLSVCLVMLQLAPSAQAQTVASAQTSSSETPAEEIQPTEPIPTKSSILGVKARSGGSGFEKGDVLLSPGISFGELGYGGLSGTSSGLLALSASLEFSINDKFAVGPYVGFSAGRYAYAYGTYKDYSRTSIGFGGKFTFHATGVFNDAFGWSIPEKVDLFSSAYLGLRTVNYTNAYRGNELYPTLGVTVGGRYFFTPNIGAFVELGYGVFGVASTGLSFKF